MALATTNQSTPASAAAWMVAPWMPPSISSRWSERRRLRISRTLGNTSGMNDCPALGTTLKAIEHDVDPIKGGKDFFDGGGRVEGDADAAAELGDFPGDGGRVFDGFDVEGQVLKPAATLRAGRVPQGLD